MMVLSDIRAFASRRCNLPISTKIMGFQVLKTDSSCAKRKRMMDPTRKSSLYRQQHGREKSIVIDYDDRLRENEL